jgi:GNAT superfamily N-acetyltransferase
MMGSYSIVHLNPDDWQILKKIRLEALSLEPQAFGSNFEKESSYDENKWREFIGEPLSKDRAIFILINGDNVIGLTGIVRSKENLEDAVLIASYIQKQYRGKGLSKILYEARIDWARRNSFSGVIVSHRQSNIASKMANQKFNFQYTGSADKVWIDGKSEKQLFYRLSLI